MIVTDENNKCISSTEYSEEEIVTNQTIYNIGLVDNKEELNIENEEENM